MMITGLISILVNWNPLMKLDGYYILCDLLDLIQLKENSTAFVSAWVKKHIWSLPVEVPYVPRRRRVWYAVYAILSGAYSYMILYVVARFAGNIVRNFSPEWGFIPEILVALLIFRSRIRLLGNFMKFLYLDKKTAFALGLPLRIGSLLPPESSCYWPCQSSGTRSQDDSCSNLSKRRSAAPGSRVR